MHVLVARDLEFSRGGDPTRPVGPRPDPNPRNFREILRTSFLAEQNVPKRGQNTNRVPMRAQLRMIFKENHNSKE